VPSLITIPFLDSGFASGSLYRPEAIDGVDLLQEIHHARIGGPNNLICICKENRIPWQRHRWYFCHGLGGLP
jgi:hypothetical protein